MAISVEIDSYSGFCGGVIRAVTKAEDVMKDPETDKLYSLGSIVHNEAELNRLQSAGLVTIGLENLKDLPEKSKVLIRAHGEPPETYLAAQRLGLEVIDCTCPVVLKLQRSIREAYSRVHDLGGQIIIFGKVGHAEVLGLLGQVGGDAVVVETWQCLRMHWSTIRYVWKALWKSSPRPPRVLPAMQPSAPLWKRPWPSIMNCHARCSAEKVCSASMTLSVSRLPDVTRNCQSLLSAMIS